MKRAAESAAKWLAYKVKANPKLNPIPYPFFKSIVNKQVEWARTQRGIRLEFEELAEAVRKELLKVGIHTMAKPEHETTSLFKGTESGEKVFICNGCAGSKGEIDKNKCPLYNVFARHSERASAHVFMCAFYHDAQKCQMPAKITKEERR